MGYCVSFKGRFDLDKPLTAEHAAALRVLEDSEANYPGTPPDKRFNPWAVAKDDRGFEVLTDKPGNWKAWLQYLIDEWLTPNGYALSGSVTWDGEDRGDAGTITIEGGKVKARRPSAAVSWTSLPASMRGHVCDRIESAAEEDRRGNADAWAAALAALGHVTETDRTVFDD